ncbi:hypothetical protein BDC45DRAFT_513496 [Circinella umbellata]|nr:hypothetical protein BDC45DRAFT_513496 [Circinella umbellata]
MLHYPLMDDDYYDLRYITFFFPLPYLTAITRCISRVYPFDFFFFLFLPQLFFLPYFIHLFYILSSFLPPLLLSLLPLRSRPPFVLVTEDKKIV